MSKAAILSDLELAKQLTKDDLARLEQVLEDQLINPSADTSERKALKRLAELGLLNWRPTDSSGYKGFFEPTARTKAALLTANKLYRIHIEGHHKSEEYDLVLNNGNAKVMIQNYAIAVFSEVKSTLSNGLRLEVVISRHFEIKPERFEVFVYTVVLAEVEVINGSMA